MCTADIGWITGHSYSVYAPLCLGITTVIVEGIPTYPTLYRYYDTIRDLKVTQFYTAPTTIRYLMKSGMKLKNNQDLISLRLVGSVGEFLNSDAYDWYKKNFCSEIVDTYWQTETGGFVIVPIKDFKSEYAGNPFYGIEPVVVNDSGEEVTNELGALCIKGKWPGMARGVLKDESRYLKYFVEPSDFNEKLKKKFNPENQEFSDDSIVPPSTQTNKYYYTGDKAINEDGLFLIRGRADDVLNVSGHRMSSAEIESSTCEIDGIAEAAVVGAKHEITGEAIVLFVTKKDDIEIEKSLIEERLRSSIGALCKPRSIYFVNNLPKTRTGKVMRRVLKGLIDDEDLGDLSTAADLEVIHEVKLVIENDSLNKK